MNPLLTDSYKQTQAVQHPPDTAAIYSHFLSRGGMFPDTTFFGLQYLLKEYLCQPATLDNVAEAKDICAKHFGDPTLFQEDKWLHIVQHHEGFLPLRIKAVPEGMTVPVHNVLMTVESLCEKCFWTTDHSETLLVQNWYPTTIATMGRHIKENLRRWTEKTGGTDTCDFKLHDFGFRGVSSVESAGLGGLAHLVNFRGTDTMWALQFGRKYYHEDMAGFSIPASQHSTMTAWGQDHEADAYQNMLTQFPTGMVAIVSDSYDIFNACREIFGRQLKAQVLARDGVVVIRPDSGHPPDVVKQVLTVLGDQFGYTRNAKGFKMLPPQLRVIQGDGVDYGMINLVCEHLYNSQWCTDNLSFGMGGALLQKLNRDTQRFAFKCSARKTQEGLWLPVSKNPVGDPGKRSRAGRMKLVEAAGAFKTVPEYEPGEDVLQVVYDSGYMRSDTSLAKVRERAAL